MGIRFRRVCFQLHVGGRGGVKQYRKTISVGNPRLPLTATHHNFSAHWTTTTLMDYADVIEFTIKCLRDNHLVGEQVIRDLLLKSRLMDSPEWMGYLKSSISSRTYAYVRDKYQSSLKIDLGFSAMCSADVCKMAHVYENVLA